ncbi:MAG: glycoside hydrolase family 11 protein [Oscillospiraceae bacterium]|nr:glycoside hydrolase family 11 protein [Oscillospiraceae bacterium]
MKIRLGISVITAIAVILSLVTFAVPAGASTTWNFGGGNPLERRETISGWDFEYWSDGGTATMIVNNDGTFSGTWNGTPNRNILMRSGKKFGTPQGVTKTHEEIGEITMTFDAAHTPLNVNSMLCVYGWTARNTMEYYIIESWGNYAKGRQSPQAELKATYTIPGEGTYELYVSHERVNQPSIFSNNDTFPQYMAIRTEKRTSGEISVSEHFRQWEAAGLTHMGGALYEVSFCVEAWGSAGSAAVNSLTLDIGEYKKPPIKPPADAEDIIIPASDFKPSTSIGTGTVNTDNDTVTVTYGNQAYGNVYTYFDVTFPGGINISDYKNLSLNFQFLAGDLGDQKRLFLLAGTPADLTGSKDDSDIGAWNVDNPTLAIADFKIVDTLAPTEYGFTFNFNPARIQQLKGLTTIRFAVYIPAAATGNDGGTGAATKYAISDIVLRAFTDECDVCTPSAADCTVCKDCGKLLEDAEHEQNPDNCRKCVNCNYTFSNELCGVCSFCTCEHETFAWVKNKCEISWACTICAVSKWDWWICSRGDIQEGCVIKYECVIKEGCGVAGEYKSCLSSTINWSGLNGTCTLCGDKRTRACWNIDEECIILAWSGDDCEDTGECTVCGHTSWKGHDWEYTTIGCEEHTECKLCGQEDSWLACTDVEWNWEKQFGVCIGRGTCNDCNEELFGTCWHRDTINQNKDTNTTTTSCTACEHVWNKYIIVPVTPPVTPPAKKPSGGGGSSTPSTETPAPPANIVQVGGASVPPNFAIPAAAVNNIASGLPFARVRITAAGNLRVSFSADTAGQNAILMKLNADGELEVVSAAAIRADGNASFNITQTGDYIVLVRKTGDITGTGTVETADALALLRHIAGISQLNAVQLLAANGKTGSKTTADALNILKTIAGLTDN